MPDQYAFTFLGMLRELIQQPYSHEILDSSLDPASKIIEPQLISSIQIKL